MHKIVTLYCKRKTKIVNLLNTINNHITWCGKANYTSMNMYELEIIIPSGTNLLSAHCTTYLLFLLPLNSQKRNTRIKR